MAIIINLFLQLCIKLSYIDSLKTPDIYLANLPLKEKFLNSTFAEVIIDESIREKWFNSMTKQGKPKKTKKPHYLGIYLLALLHQTDLWVKWHKGWFPREQADKKEEKRKEADPHGEENENSESIDPSVYSDNPKDTCESLGKQ
jgi:cytoskeletal protein RodZ